MINIGVPKEGWISLAMGEGEDCLVFEISDVGPDSVGQFIVARDALSSGEPIAHVECYLEPAVLKIMFCQERENVKARMEIDGVEEKTLVFNRSAFLAKMSSELGWIVPLCLDPHWTHPNWSRKQ